MSHLRRSPAEKIFFLTACHATPLYSFLHGDRGGDQDLGFLDCSPGATRPSGSPHSRFFQTPMPMLKELFPEAVHNVTEEAAPRGAALMACLDYRYSVSKALPEVFVLWGSLQSHEPRLLPWLQSNGFAFEVELQDGVWSEGPYGVELWPSFQIFRRKAKGQRSILHYYSILCFIVLYCIVLYYIVLYCIVLYCVVLCCVVLCCVVLCCVVLCCVVLYCIVLYCIVLYCIVLYCIVLYCIVLYCIVLYCIVLYILMVLHCIV